MVSHVSENQNEECKQRLFQSTYRHERCPFPQEAHVALSESHTSRLHYIRRKENLICAAVWIILFSSWINPATLLDGLSDSSKRCKKVWGNVKFFIQRPFKGFLKRSPARDRRVGGCVCARCAQSCWLVSRYKCQVFLIPKIKKPKIFFWVKNHYVFNKKIIMASRVSLPSTQRRCLICYH